MNTLLPTDAFLVEFDEDEPDGVWPFGEGREFDVAC